MSDSASRPVTVGLLGLGYWGPNLARNFARLPGANLKWLCDLSPELRTRYEPQFPAAQMTDDYQQLLDDPGVDAIVLASPVPTHYPLGKRALEAGKHTFIEKPIAMTFAEASELAELADERDLRLMVGHLLEYHPAVLKVREMIAGGELGDMLYAYSNRLNLGKVRSDENALWSLGVHDVATLMFLVGEEPVEVSARGESYLREGVEDVVFAYMKFPSGVVAHIHLSWLDPHKMRKLTVVGSQKMVVFDDMESDRKVTVYDKSAEIGRTDTYGEYVNLRFGDIWSPRIPNDEPLRLECEHFLDAVRNGTTPRSDGHDGARVVHVLEAMQQSLQQRGTPITLSETVGSPA